MGCLPFIDDDDDFSSSIFDSARYNNIYAFREKKLNSIKNDLPKNASIQFTTKKLSKP